MSLIPPHYLNSVVSIEIENKNSEGEIIKKSIATGFLVGNAINVKQGEETRFQIFIVTNRHVFQDQRTKQFLPEVFFASIHWITKVIISKQHYSKKINLHYGTCTKMKM